MRGATQRQTDDASRCSALERRGYGKGGSQVAHGYHKVVLAAGDGSAMLNRASKFISPQLRA